MYTNLFRVLILALSTITLVACGGGGGSEKQEAPPIVSLDGGALGYLSPEKFELLNVA